MRRKRNKSVYIFIFIYILVLGLCTIFTTFAKYNGMISRNYSTQVAKWNVSVISDEYDILPTMVIGDDSTFQNYNFSITSISEVAVDYSVIISNVPSGVLVKVDDDIIYEEDNNTILINNLGSFNANDTNSTHNHKLTFMVPIGVETIENAIFDLDVIVTQVRP